MSEELHQLAAMLKTQPGGLVAKLDALQKENRGLRKDLEKAAAQAASGQGGDLMSKIEEINGVKVLAAKLGTTNIKALREVMDDIRSKLPSGVACVAAPVDESKVSMILYVSKDLHGRFTAPALIKEVAAPIAGSGGGRPDQAQAGGTNPAGIDEALAVLKAKIAVPKKGVPRVSSSSSNPVARPAAFPLLPEPSDLTGPCPRFSVFQGEIRGRRKPKRRGEAIGLPAGAVRSIGTLDAAQKKGTPRSPFCDLSVTKNRKNGMDGVSLRRTPPRGTAIPFSDAPDRSCGHPKGLFPDASPIRAAIRVPHNTFASG